MSYQQLTMGEIVEDLIKESGKTLTEHAQEMGMKQSVLSDIVNDKRINGPSSKIIKQLAQHFDVSADYLLGLSPARTADIDIKGVCEFLGCNEEIMCNLIVLFQYTNNSWIDKKVLNAFIINKVHILLKLITTFCDSLSSLEDEIQKINEKNFVDEFFEWYINCRAFSRTIYPEDKYSCSNFWYEVGKDSLYYELRDIVNPCVDRIDLLRLKIDRFFNECLDSIYPQFLKNPDWHLLSSDFVESLIEEKITKTEKELYSIAEKAEREDQ